MDRPVAQPEREARTLGRLLDYSLEVIRQPRGGDVDRLFEVWAHQRIGLVEDGQCPQRATVQQSFERDFDPGDVALDEYSVRVAGTAFGQRLLGRED